jgi:hypothetical protein
MQDLVKAYNIISNAIQDRRAVNEDDLGWAKNVAKEEIELEDKANETSGVDSERESREKQMSRAFL